MNNRNEHTLELNTLLDRLIYEIRELDKKYKMDTLGIHIDKWGDKDYKSSTYTK